MKQHLNTLFVTTEGCYLAKSGQAVAVRKDKKVLLRVTLHNLGGIVCFGRNGVSPSLMEACGAAGITISMASVYGRFRAAIVGFSPGNVLLRREQYRAADDETRALPIAANSVAAKIANSRSVLLRGARDLPDEASRNDLAKAADRLAWQIDGAWNCKSLDTLRGVEGDAANTYFEAFPRLITCKEGFRFYRRSRRPPLDPVNCLLSFLYAMLAHDARSACEAVGLGRMLPEIGETRLAGPFGGGNN